MSVNSISKGGGIQIKILSAFEWETSISAFLTVHLVQTPSLLSRFLLWNQENFCSMGSPQYAIMILALVF